MSGHFPLNHNNCKVTSGYYFSEIVPRDSFRLSKFSKTSSMSLRMASTSQGSGGIKEATSEDMAGVSVNRARDCSGERPMALPNMHSQRMLWNCNSKKIHKMNYFTTCTSMWFTILVLLITIFIVTGLSSCCGRALHGCTSQVYFPLFRF